MRQRREVTDYISETMLESCRFIGFDHGCIPTQNSIQEGGGKGRKMGRKAGRLQVP